MIVFSMRIDPMLDGLANSVQENDIVMSTHPTGSTENWAGNAFQVKKTLLKTTAEGRRDVDERKSRSWSIHGSRTHPT